MLRAIVVTYFVLIPETAEAYCHHYRYWFYPTPQRCETRVAIREMPIVFPPKKEQDIPLPELINEDWNSGNADEETKARLMLRSIIGK